MTRIFGAMFAPLVFVLLLPVGLAHSAPFKDGAGRTVEIPDKVAKIIPAGPPAEVLLYALAPEKLAGLVEAFPAQGRPYVPEAYRDLPLVPRLSRRPTAADFDRLRKLPADLIVDYGNTGKNFVAAIGKAQEGVGKPAVLLDGKLAATPQTLRDLGKAIGVAERGERLAGLAQKALDRLAPLARLGRDERIAVYLARGRDGLNAARAGTSLSEAIEFAGGRNVATSGAGAFLKLSVEEVVALAPEVVIFEDPAALKSPLRAALPAKTRVYLDQPAPFGALESPPSLNRIIGAVALAGVLHPGKMPPDTAFLADLQQAFFGPVPAGQKFAPLVAK